MLFDGLDVVKELFVEGVACQGGHVPHDDELHAGARDGDIHAAQVVQEADLPCSVGTHHRDEYNIALLPLEAIDGVDRDQMAEWLEKRPFLDQALEVLDLGAVR